MMGKGLRPFLFLVCVFIAPWAAASRSAPGEQWLGQDIAEVKKSLGEPVQSLPLPGKHARYVFKTTYPNRRSMDEPIVPMLDVDPRGTVYIKRETAIIPPPRVLRGFCNMYTIETDDVDKVVTVKHEELGC
jgi:hypothetical protein